MQLFQVFDCLAWTWKPQDHCTHAGFSMNLTLHWLIQNKNCGYDHFCHMLIVELEETDVGPSAMWPTLVLCCHGSRIHVVFNTILFENILSMMKMVFQPQVEPTNGRTWVSRTHKKWGTMQARSQTISASRQWKRHAEPRLYMGWKVTSILEEPLSRPPQFIFSLLGE